MKPKVLLNEKQVAAAIEALAKAIVAEKKNLKKVVFIGVLKRGDHIADRIAAEVKRLTKTSVPTGYMDITLYRDDFSSLLNKPLPQETVIPVDLTDKEVILIDDVLFTGRSTRAALEAIMDYGRPKKIQLCALIDRSHREIPIHADFVGKDVVTEYSDRIKVHLKEIDGKDEILLIKQEVPATLNV